MEIAHEQWQAKKDHDTAKYKTLNQQFQQQACQDMNDHFLRECEKVKEQSKRGNCREVFRAIRRLSGMTIARMPVIKDKTRKVLTEGVQVKEQWREYTQELYHCDPFMRDVYTPHPFSPEPQVTKEEVRSALESLVKGKAPGIDDIPIEL